MSQILIVYVFYLLQRRDNAVYESNTHNIFIFHSLQQRENATYELNIHSSYFSFATTKRSCCLVYHSSQQRDNVVCTHIVINESSYKVYYIWLWCWLYFQWALKGANINFHESEFIYFHFYDMLIQR